MATNSPQELHHVPHGASMAPPILNASDWQAQLNGRAADIAGVPSPVTGLERGGAVVDINGKNSARIVSICCDDCLNIKRSENHSGADETLNV